LRFITDGGKRNEKLMPDTPQNLPPRLMAEFHIKSFAISEDRALVEQILIVGAERFDMLDASVTSRVPDTIRWYTKTIKGEFGAGARVAGDIIVVDLVDGRQPSPFYSELEAYFVAELQRAFGDRVSKAERSQRIPFHNSLPPSEAARDFMKKHMKV
jgi:hypothetical protein